MRHQHQWRPATPQPFRTGLLRCTINSGTPSWVSPSKWRIPPAVVALRWCRRRPWVWRCITRVQRLSSPTARRHGGWARCPINVRRPPQSPWRSCPLPQHQRHRQRQPRRPRQQIAPRAASGPVSLPAKLPATGRQTLGITTSEGFKRIWLSGRDMADWPTRHAPIWRRQPSRLLSLSVASPHKAQEPGPSVRE
jgi:hypothetical protein